MKPSVSATLCKIAKRLTLGFLGILKEMITYLKALVGLLSGSDVLASVRDNDD